MQFSKLALVVSFLRVVAAQTPEGFTPIVSQTLSVSYGNNSISPPGELVPRPETATPPNVSTTVFPTTGQAIFFLVDLDVPRNGTRVTYLHWFAPGTTGISNSANSTSLSIATDGGPGGAAYVQPSPPVGDFPHRYVFLLYSQPSDFAIPAAFANISDNRIGFNLSSFVEAASLADPVAANFITVQNLTGAAATTFPPASFTPSPTGGASSTGGGGAISTGGAGPGASVVAGGSGMSFVMGALWLFGML